MGKTIQKSKGGKRPGAGRPATGFDPVRTMRISDVVMAKVDSWAAGQGDQPGRAEAFCRLVELGLTVKTKAKPTGRVSAALVSDLAAEAIDSLAPQVKAPRPVGKLGRKLRAQELATKAIEKIIDPAAPLEERTQRRRRLTKGPTEFRNVRVDQPKAKGK